MHKYHGGLRVKQLRMPINHTQSTETEVSIFCTNKNFMCHWLSGQVQVKALRRTGICFWRLEKFQLVSFVGEMFGDTVSVVS